MAVKRKRSDQELCSSPSSSSSSSSSIFSSPPTRSSVDLHPPAFDRMSPANLHCRTRKRHRDNRPSEEQVHQRTLNLLYSAQQQQQQQSPPTHAPSPSDHDVSPTEPTTQQSLHRFWTISSAAPAALSRARLHVSTPAPCACEDCGAGLGGAHGMDLDGFSSTSTACGACGKHVCFSCSVSNLGDEMRCLRCAGSRIARVGWAGGMSI